MLFSHYFSFGWHTNNFLAPVPFDIHSIKLNSLITPQLHNDTFFPTTYANDQN